MAKGQVVVVAWAQQAWAKGLVQEVLWQGVSLWMVDRTIPEPRSERLHRQVHLQAMRRWETVGRLQGPHRGNLAGALSSGYLLLILVVAP
jgi:hypothetical protein